MVLLHIVASAHLLLQALLVVARAHLQQWHACQQQLLLLRPQMVVVVVTGRVA